MRDGSIVKNRNSLQGERVPVFPIDVCLYSFSSFFVPCLIPSAYSLELYLLYALKWISVFFFLFFLHLFLVGLLSLIPSIPSCTPPFSVIGVTLTKNCPRRAEPLGTHLSDGL